MNDFSPHGVDLFGDPIRPEKQSPVASKFIVPPFSVLSARDGEWQDRKRAWASLGIQGETGRNNACGYSNSTVDRWNKKLNEQGKSGVWRGSGRIDNEGEDSGVSIFDPVLCELAYSWFTAPEMQVLDPFSGGSVRGIVAGLLGRKYQGHELRLEQVDANIAQCADIAPQAQIKYVVGDSAKTLKDAPECDFVFSCPPYGDLEVYSDAPDDLSAMTHQDFLKSYRDIIAQACAKLRDNRFACFVVGDFRDKKGSYRNFVSDTIQAFLDCGMNYYNEGILVTSIGSACMRVGWQFEASRKFAKTHQNILVFVKGDGKKATEAIRNYENQNH
jgi:DNA modification methylase